MIAQVSPVIDYSVRDLCRHPYPGHDKGKRIGCPNHGEKPGCPPKAKYFDRYYDLSRPLFAIYASFAIGEHAARMKGLHPGWSDSQTHCCLYWQGTANKQLKQLVMEFLRNYKLTDSWLYCILNLGFTAHLPCVEGVPEGVSFRGAFCYAEIHAYYGHPYPGYIPVFRPEAMGVNITETMKGSGVILEWPPRILVYKVALAGVPLLRNRREG